MSTTEEFAKTSWGWQLSLFQQQLGEWIELQLSRFKSPFPKTSTPDWSFDAPWLVDLIKALIWLIAIAITLWLLWQVWKLLAPITYSWRGRKSTKVRSKANLPQLTVNQWLEKSQAYFAQGNYAEACRCLYQATLQHLHDRKIIAHQFSRTDGEYLQLLKDIPPSPAYQKLLATHEQLCFSNAEILKENFEQCKQAYKEISKP